MPTDAPSPLGLDEAFFKAILGELIDENPMACRAVLSLAAVRFTSEVPTLAVTLTRPVELLVNLDFVRKHCHTEEDVKAVLIHEFLHILLGHTERFDRMDRALNVALDAVINAIIHRRLGPDYSAFFQRYYARAEGVIRMLRPMTDAEVSEYRHVLLGSGRAGGMLYSEYTVVSAWSGVYKGTLVVDDILAVAESLSDDLNWGRAKPPLFIGGHESGVGDASEAVEEALRQIDGEGIWRSGRAPGTGVPGQGLASGIKDERVELWERTALKALRQALLPDRHGSPTAERFTDSFLPVLSPVDRRAFLSAMWNPVIPNARWPLATPSGKASAHVYLDVSGSMNTEMEALVGLMRHMLPWIKRPFWAFSTRVEPADIRDGKLVTATTGGTDLDPVLKHVVASRVRRALIITDGHVGRCDAALLEKARGCRIHVLVSRGGFSRAIEEAGLPFTQLDAFVNGDPERLPRIPWGVPAPDRARPRAANRQKTSS